MELFKSDEVLKSEDEKNSLTSEKETQKKLEALLFIRDLAIQLGLSQSCVATAQVYFHKFAVTNSIGKFDSLHLAGACIFLAAKALEQPKHLENVCRRFYVLRSTIQTSLNPRLQVPPLSDSMLRRLAKNIEFYEFWLLNEIGFNFEIPLPYPYIHNFIFPLNISPQTRKNVLRYACNFANDCFRTTLALQKSAENIAEACIFLAVKFLQLEMPVPADQDTVAIIRDLYRHS
ncbi:CycK [Blepharisma stoltei]|uniref:Cyclin-like domain-containing protein n=1 Tax=Blepharisma stoltei TaxID=1481888 RepID=A0AAU9JHL6_9CILI|nr:unnamed protein product [Blepharisma stoltei]